LNDSGAVGVHEWCEIRLIRTQGRLDLRDESGGFGIRGGLFGYFLTRCYKLVFSLVELTFAHTKSDKIIVDFI
jgi:hypothetical protein